MTDEDRGPIPRFWLPVALGVFAGAAVAEVQWRPMNGDASWYVYVAGRLLDGDRPYVDLIDTNPPLILWLDMAVVAAGRALGIEPLRAFQLAVFGAIGLSLALSWLASRGLPRTLREACLAAFGFMLLVGVGPAFGQREHLAVALILPYAFAVASEARGDRPPARLAILTGLLAGVGFSLKPFFVLIAAAVEMWLGSRRGRRVWARPQALAIAAVIIVYGALIMVITPQYFDAARRLAPLYPAHNPMGSTLVANSWRLVIVVAAMALAWASIRRRSPGFVEVFLLIDAWFTVSLYLTGKGWDYHWFPPLAFSWALAIGSAALLLEPAMRRRRRLATGRGRFARSHPNGATDPRDAIAPARPGHGADRPIQHTRGGCRVRALAVAPQVVPDGPRTGPDLGPALSDAAADRGVLPRGLVGARPIP